ncbi:MAG TPA: hypothetical protein VGI16_10085 [Candidatus Acidoferrum sp.]
MKCLKLLHLPVMSVSIALFFFANVMAAQGPKAKRPYTREKQIDQFLESLGDLRIEYRADIQLTAIEKGKVPNEKLVRQVLTDLLENADQAEFPYKIISEDRNQQTTRQNRIAADLNALNLDALSIKTRAIRSLLTRNRQEASQHFQDLQLNIPPTACRSAMVPDVRDYYQTFSAIGNLALAASAKAREQFLFWANEQMGLMTSSTQLLPSANALLDLKLSANEFKILSDTFTLKLSALQATDGELRVLENKPTPLSNGIERLAHKLQEQSWPVIPLLQSYQTFLERSAKQPVCSDLTTDWKRVSENYYHLYPELGVAKPEKIDFYTIRQTAEKGGTAEVDFMPSVAAMYTRIFKLMDRKNAERRGSAPAAINTAFPSWESDLADSLKDIDAMDPSRSSCPVCVFASKASLLYFCFGGVPPGEWKDKTLEQLASVLADASFQKDYPIEWGFAVFALLNSSRSPSEKLAKEIHRAVLEGYSLNGLPSDYGPQIRQALKRTGNRTLNAYVAADELFQYEFILPYPLPPPRSTTSDQH